jgi:peptidyl-tRNA hydrolase
VSGLRERSERDVTLRDATSRDATPVTPLAHFLRLADPSSDPAWVALERSADPVPAAVIDDVLGRACAAARGEEPAPTSPDATPARHVDPVVLFLVVRTSLDMSPGKVAAQVGHAVQRIVRARYVADLGEDGRRAAVFDAWVDGGEYRKVVLAADEKEWAKVRAAASAALDPDVVVVADLGLTELSGRNETVVGFWPTSKSTAPRVLSRLQALKIDDFTVVRDLREQLRSCQEELRLLRGR